MISMGVEENSESVPTLLEKEGASRFSKVVQEYWVPPRECNSGVS